MTDTSVPARFAESDFRVGNVINRTASIFSRHFLTFFIITIVAYLPMLLFAKGAIDEDNIKPEQIGLAIVGGFLMVILSVLSQAVILHAAFQDMRGRPVNLSESLKVGLSRFFPVIGLAIIVVILGGLAFMLLIIPGLIVFTMWFVGTPVCVVEHQGPWTSLKRSSQLTKGHRWKVFGLMLALFIVSGAVAPVIEQVFPLIGGAVLTAIAGLIWNAVWGAFYAIAVVVTYHDLRAAKEGIDIEQIASVFD